MRIMPYLFFALFAFSSNSFAANEFEVEKVLESGDYVINGVSWKPHTSCSSLKKGDKVSFTNGNANGQCVTATIMDKNSNTTCKLWCEDEAADE